MGLLRSRKTHAKSDGFALEVQIGYSDESEGDQHVNEDSALGLPAVPAPPSDEQMHQADADVAREAADQDAQLPPERSFDLAPLPPAGPSPSRPAPAPVPAPPSEGERSSLQPAGLPERTESATPPSAETPDSPLPQRPRTHPKPVIEASVQGGGDKQPAASEQDAIEDRPEPEKLKREGLLKRLLGRLRRRSAEPAAESADQDRKIAAARPAIGELEALPPARNERDHSSSPEPEKRKPAPEGPAAPPRVAAAAPDPKPLPPAPHDPVAAEPIAEPSPPRTPRAGTRRLTVEGAPVVDASLREQERRERRRKEELARERRQARQRTVKGIVGAPKRALERLSQRHDRENRERSQKRIRRQAERERNKQQKAERKRQKAEARKQKAAERVGVLGALKARRQKWRAERARKAGRDIVGLAIGDSSLRILHLREGEPIEIFEHPLPGGVVVDGLLEEPKELTAALKEAWRRSEISSKKVNLSICNRLVTLRTWQVAAENDGDLEQALAMRARRIIAPMNPESSIIDYAELSRSGPQISLQIAAADTKMVKDFVEAVERAGLLAVSCEIGPLAASRALVIQREARASRLVVDIGAELTSITAASGPDVFFLRVLDIGGNDFTRAIATELQIPWGEAEQMKAEVGLEGPSEHPEQTTMQARMAMRLVADRLSQEITQTRLHFERQTPDKPVHGYMTLGGGSRLRGLSEHIRLFAGLPEPETLIPRPGLEGTPDIDLTAEAVGLARGHSMSLLPDIKPRSFSLASPFRRKSKISLSQAERAAKRLTAERKPAGAGTSPKLIGIFVGLLLFGGMFMLGPQLAPEDLPGDDEPTVPAGPELIYNNRAVQNVSHALLSTPRFGGLNVVIGSLAASEADLQSLHTEGRLTMIEASADSEAAAQDAYNRAQQAFSGSAENLSIDLGPVTEGEQSFTLVLDSGDDPMVQGPSEEDER